MKYRDPEVHAMDFRKVDPASVTFKLGGRRGAVAASAPGGKVRVQFPECPCSVSVHSPGAYRVDLKFPASETHEAFVGWLNGLEAAAAAGSSEWAAGLAPSPTLYFDGTVWSMRLLVWSDALAFDERGELSADLPSAKKCIVLADLAGAWTTDAKWGLRWKVVQIKFWTRSDLTLPERRPRDESCLFDKC